MTTTAPAVHPPPRHVPQPYRDDYERGWRYSHSSTATLDHLDAKRASDAEQDGYLDFATGREKWHLAWCRDGAGACPHDHRREDTALACARAEARRLARS